MEGKKFEEYLDECFKIIDENVEVLSGIEFEIEQQKDDEIIPNLHLHDLIDMTQDVAESIKIRKAEASYMRRQLD
ncbi:MAG: hypothetical protein AABX15_03680 [Thermoproteota archaeon]|jgi:hypothetical protein|nr:hypothetical protein [Nitrosopumilaceae archaeon]